MTKASLAEFALILHPDDDVAVLRKPVKAGTTLAGGRFDITIKTAIPAGHKVALRAITEGEPVRKYSHIIGFARGAIVPGDHVHTHNLVAKEFTRDGAFRAAARPLAPYPPEQMRFFQGYARPGGRVGTRNYVAVISIVNCSASVARFAAERFRGPELQRDYPNVDGVVALTFKGGCGLPDSGPLRVLQRTLAGFVRHPNFSGCVLIGLGCEVNQMHLLREAESLDGGPAGTPGPTFLNIQDAGGTRKTIEAAAAAIHKLLPYANAQQRTRQPVSKLVLALKCGGSDGNSGITANPALGVASDELVRLGGTSVLAETPEIYGAEHLLARRAGTREVAEKIGSLIRWWEDHARRQDAVIDNNPSFGNKAGGITTIYEKSLGAIAKGGQAPLTAVYEYAAPVTRPGLCFMDTPGYDPVSMTGLVAGGCNVAVFTTGRGSVYGCQPTPCLKVASNTPLFRHMEEDMDLNAGTILEGTETLEQTGRRIFEKIIAVAGGEKTKSERLGIGEDEFAPWHLGPTF